MRLLTFNDLRAILGGRGRTTIYRDVAAGRLPKPIKIGGRIYWRDSEIESFLEQETYILPSDMLETQQKGEDLDCATEGVAHEQC